MTLLARSRLLFVKERNRTIKSGPSKGPPRSSLRTGIEPGDCGCGFCRVFTGSSSKRTAGILSWTGRIRLWSHEDFVPTFAAAAGETGLVEKLKAGFTLNGRKFKVHLDGY